jgi:hypothetical protein
MSGTQRHTNNSNNVNKIKTKIQHKKANTCWTQPHTNNTNNVIKINKNTTQKSQYVVDTTTHKQH